jgi:outer membrane receptor protein involved in Fe transport
MIRKSAWLLSAALVAVPNAAFAQDNSTATKTTTPSPTEKAGVTPQAQAAAQAQDNQIIITAQGRRQVLQDVPIAVTAVGGNEMKNSGATDIRQLNQLAPSLLVSSTGTEANGSARIRGIGTVGDNPGLESSVSVFIDGVYRSRSGMGLNELGEIDRVEVLRGPQGTLFGRNSSAGLINIITKKPRFTPEVYGEATIGNYSLKRLAGGATGPLTDTLAARLDAVWVKRDGFYNDPANHTTINNRNRFFTRGQLLFQPNDKLSVRLIGDYTWRKERCCAAVYVDNSVNSNIGNLNEVANPLLQPGAVPARTNDSGNNIVNVLRDLGQNLNALHSGYSRTVSVTPGRDYTGTTRDYGLSGEVDYNLGGASLTSITAYRHYYADQGGDIDYSTVDILYRDPGGASRRFNTFSQELRLQGNAFDNHLDWLVGAYYANEDLALHDNLKFGSQYGRFATCRIVSPGGLSALYNPAAPGCLAARPPIFGLASPLIYAAFDNLDHMNNVGSVDDRYHQKSNNWALFTHNIFHVTQQVDLTIGARYTHESKDFDAQFKNNNTACTANQALLVPFVDPKSPAFNTALWTVSQALLNLSCQGNSTAELNGVSINSKRSEGKLTGTGVLSYKPDEHLLLYASYSRGYKAGGFNLDRSALKAPALPFSNTAPFTNFGGAQALVNNLQFAPETVNNYEIGGKFTRHGFLFNVAVFQEDFKNFQLNTFDGTVFIVQNINGCSANLNGQDRDQSVNPGSPNFIPPVIAAGTAFNLNPAAGTGACPSGDVGWGVRSRGIELESTIKPMNDLTINLGYTYANTKYRDNLVGAEDGTPLNPALRVLPGNNISNAPRSVATASLAWTPRIGSSLRGLFYVDGRLTSDYNTGSDLFPQKLQQSYAVVNGRIGLQSANGGWSVELWAQNLFDKDYAQVAFNSPFQAGGSTTPPWAPGFTFAPFIDPQYPGSRQLFSMFLAEPRTFGVTLRGHWAGGRAPAPAYAPPPPPPPPPATQTCPDGSVILATATCPAPPPPPPPPPPAPERG